MINIFRKLFSKPFKVCTERHETFLCFMSFDPTIPYSKDLYKDFYNKHHFLVGCNMYDVNWDEKIILEEILKKLVCLYGFGPEDKDLMIVKDPKRIYLPTWEYVDVAPGGIVAYDKSKLKVFIDNL